MFTIVCSKSLEPNSSFSYNATIYQQRVIIFGEVKATEKYFTPVKEKIEKNKRKLVKNEDKNFEHLKIMTFIC